MPPRIKIDIGFGGVVFTFFSVVDSGEVAQPGNSALAASAAPVARTRRRGWEMVGCCDMRDLEFVDFDKYNLSREFESRFCKKYSDISVIKNDCNDCIFEL